MLQVVNKISTTGGVEVVAQNIQRELGGLIIAFEPHNELIRLSPKKILQPKKAFSLKGQFIPIDLKFYIKVFEEIKLSNKILLHQPTLAASIISIFLFVLRKNYSVLKHARGDGVYGNIIEKLTTLLNADKKCNLVVTSRHELKFSKLTGKASIVSFPLERTIERKQNTELNRPQTNSTVKLLFIGRLVEYKGISQLIDEIILANATKTSVLLDVVGDGKLLNTIKSKIKGRSDVRCHGYISAEKKDELLASCDAVIVSSRMKGEAFNLTQLEAIQRNKAVVLRRLTTGTQDTAWRARTVIRYDDGGLPQAIDKLKRLTLEDYEHDRKHFNEKYNKKKFLTDLKKL